MPNQTNDKIAHAQKLNDQFKYKEALEILNNIENVNELSQDDQITFYLLQSYLFLNLGQFNEALDTANWVFKNCIKNGNDLIMLDASLVMGKVLFRLGKNEECYNSILKCEELISKIKDQDEKIIGKRKIELSFIKGNYYWQISKFDKNFEILKETRVLCQKYGTKRDISKVFCNIGSYYSEIGDFRKALENYENALKIDKEINDKVGMSSDYNNIGCIYMAKGDLDHSLESFQRSLSLSEELGYNVLLGFNLENLGLTYYEKGELDKSLKYLKRSYQYKLEVGNNFGISSVLFNTIPIYLDQNDLKSAQICLEKIKNISKKDEDKRNNYMYLIAKALILKKTGGTRNIIRAEDILNKLLKEKSIENELLIIILLNLCELFNKELQITNEPEILEDITPIITKLIEISEKVHSFSLLAEIYLFKAKLELINLKLDEAQRLLTRAQQITQKFGLTRLEKKISMEHDQLLEKLEIWMELKNRNATLSERLKLVSFEGDLDLMMRKKEIEQVEILPEEPLLLSIVSKGGLSLFSHIFSKEWQNKLMFNSFMTAFNMFSHEFFSKALDRVKIGENSIIMVPFEDKFLCYVIKGQTYPARQKLYKFSEGIKNSKEILAAINSSFSTGAIINEENSPDLGELVKTIFA